MRFQAYLKEDEEAVEIQKPGKFDGLILGKHNDKREEFKKANIEEWNMGIAVEREHVPDGTDEETAYEIASRIAADHLAECENYYTGLAEMEAQCSAESEGGDELAEPENPGSF